MSTMQDIKIQAAVKAMLNNGLNQSKAAKELGISRGCLRMLLTELSGSSRELGAAVLRAAQV